jgi:hypothetical protein
MAEQEKAPRTIVSQGKNYKIYSDGTILIADVRASYPHLDKKWAKNPAKETPKYSVVGILPNSTHAAAIQLLRDHADGLIKAHPKITKIKADAYFVRDGDQSAKDEYADAWTINASETNRPAVLNTDKSAMDIDEIADIIKPGARIDMLIEPWMQDNEHGQRCNASLRGVRYLRMIEGEEIGEGGLSDDEVMSSFDDDDDGGFGDDADGGL